MDISTSTLARATSALIHSALNTRAIILAQDNALGVHFTGMAPVSAVILAFQCARVRRIADRLLASAEAEEQAAKTLNELGSLNLAVKALMARSLDAELTATKDPVVAARLARVSAADDAACEEIQRALAAV